MEILKIIHIFVDAIKKIYHINIIHIYRIYMIKQKL